MKRKRSYTEEEFIEAVKTCFSIAQVCRKLGLVAAGAGYKTVNSGIAKLKLDTGHFTGKLWSKGKKLGANPKVKLDDILTNASPYTSTHRLKNRLFAEGIFQRKCSNCLLEQWMGFPIPLELDHINGDNKDNSLENLRILCPNCHSMTPTHAGKNKPKKLRSKSKLDGMTL
jgi:hypothetical protein